MEEICLFSFLYALHRLLTTTAAAAAPSMRSQSSRTHQRDFADEAGRNTYYIDVRLAATTLHRAPVDNSIHWVEKRP